MRRELVKLGFRKTLVVKPNALTKIKAQNTNSLLGYSNNYNPLADTSSSLSNERFLTSGEEYPALHKLYKLFKNKHFNFNLGKGNKLTIGHIGKTPFGYSRQPDIEKSKLKTIFKDVEDDRNLYGLR